MAHNASPSDISILSGGVELLERIEPLWLELRRHHADLAPMWRAELLAATFEGRKIGLLNKADGGIRVLLAVHDDKLVGYCVCTIDSERLGEVDSLYVTDTHRKLGIGRTLMDEAMAWLGERASGGINVEVLAGNEAALRLYERFGFHARTIKMRHVAQ